MPDSQIWTHCSHMINNENSIQFSTKKSKKALNDGRLCVLTNQNTLKLSSFKLSFGSAQMSSEHLQTFLATFRSLQKVIRNLQKSLRHFGNPSHDTVKTSSIWFRRSRQVFNSCNVDVLYVRVSLLTFVCPFSLCRTETLNFLDWFWRWLIGVDHNRDSQKSRKLGVKFHEMSCNSCWWHC